MSKFISGQNLLTRLDIPPFELLRYVKKGLQPIDRYSKPILPPAISSKLDRLKFDCKQLKMDIRMLSEKRFQTEDEKRWLQMKLKRFENDKKELEQLEGKYSWEDYELPEEVKFAERVIDSLLNAYYNMGEVEAIEKATLELSINSEIESVSNQKEKIAPLENISEYLSKAGKKGGEKPKKNQPILLAIIKYLQDHPKLEGKTNFQIGESFKSIAEIYEKVQKTYSK